MKKIEHAGTFELYELHPPTGLPSGMALIVAEPRLKADGARRVEGFVVFEDSGAAPLRRTHKSSPGRGGHMISEEALAEDLLKTLLPEMLKEHQRGYPGGVQERVSLVGESPRYEVVRVANPRENRLQLLRIAGPSELQRVRDTVECPSLRDFIDDVLALGKAVGR